MRSPIRLAFIGISVVVVAFAMWAGWLAWQVNRDLSAAVDDAQTLRSAVEDGDQGASEEALDSLQAHAAQAANRTDGPTWSALTHLPVVGDDAQGVRVVSQVVDDLSTSGIDALIDTSDGLDGVVPADGRVDVEAVEDLQAPVASARRAFAQAQADLAAEDSSGYVERLRLKYRELESEVEDASRVLGSADSALQVMPSMLGAEGPQDYLLVFQNNAEIRATGGLPGAVSLMHAEDGRVELTRQVAANSFGRVAKPVLSLTPAEKQIYGPVLGQYFLDANLTPDFPRASDLMRARWEQVYPEELDGVFSMDPVTLSYVLEVTGPVQVGDMELTADNAVDELLHNVYLRYESPADQDAWFREVARAVFDRVLAGVESPQDLVRALARGVDEGRVYIHSFDEAEQAAISKTKVSGDVSASGSAPDEPQVGVYLNDATGAKMSYFLRYDVDVTSTYCRGTVQGLAGHAMLYSDTPEDVASLPDYVTGGGTYGTKPGSQLDFVNIYGPAGGQISDVEINSRPVRGLRKVSDQGRPVATVVVELEPQEKLDLTWRMVTAEGQQGPVRVSVTPGVLGRAYSTVVGAC